MHRVILKNKASKTIGHERQENDAVNNRKCRIVMMNEEHCADFYVSVRGLIAREREREMNLVVVMALGPRL